jgi:hypothetical protein
MEMSYLVLTNQEKGKKMHGNKGRLRPDLSERNKANATHGKAGTSTYHTWRSIKERCCNPYSKDWKNYGGRGIAMCQEWIDSFANFLEDMGDRPAGMSIDRIDNMQGYSKDNCRWASVQTQSNNRRTCVYVEYEGKSQSVADWAREVGLERKTLEYRIRSGWSPERALTTQSLIRRK